MEFLTLALTYGPAILKLINDMQPIVASLVDKHGATQPEATQLVTNHYIVHSRLPSAEEAWMNRQNATGCARSSAPASCATDRGR